MIDDTKAAGMAENEFNGSLFITRTSTSDQAADLIRQRILGGEFAPGTRLREALLAESMGISRNTLREGVSQLVAEGVLQHNVHKGVVVASPTVEDVREVFQIRRQLELEAVRQCPSGLVDALAGIERDLEGALASRDYQTLVALDLRFHKAIVDSLGNSRLSSFFANTLAGLRLALYRLDADEQRFNWIEDHRKLRELLISGDRRGAVRLLKAHLATTEKDLVKGLSESS
jgi:DNA-binding GntR family transcriptional regulator